MADEVIRRDANAMPVMAAIDNSTGAIKNLLVEDATGALIVSGSGGVPFSGNLTQINGSTILAGNGVTGAGSMRVTIASDNTPFHNIVDSGTITTVTTLTGTTTLTPGTGATNLGKAEDAAHVSGDTGVMILAVRSDTPASTANTTGDYAAQIQGSLGHTWVEEGFIPGAEDNTNNVYAILPRPVASATYAPSRFQNLGANATLNIKASTGNIFSIYSHNVSGANRWFQLHNTATTPAGGAVPVYSFYYPAGGVVEIDNNFFTQAGVNGTNGWAFSCSTTEGTYTAATATDHFSYVQFI